MQQQQQHRPLVEKGNAAQYRRHCSHATLHWCVGHSCRSALPPAHLAHGPLADIHHGSGASFCADAPRSPDSTSLSESVRQ